MSKYMPYLYKNLKRRYRHPTLGFVFTLLSSFTCTETLNSFFSCQHIVMMEQIAVGAKEKGIGNLDARWNQFEIKAWQQL